MNGFKTMLQSRTIWAAFVGLLATLLLKSGYTIGEDDQAAIVNNILNGVEVVSYIAAIFFRVRASKQIVAKTV